MAIAPNGILTSHLRVYIRHENMTDSDDYWLALVHQLKYHNSGKVSASEHLTSPMIARLTYRQVYLGVRWFTKAQSLDEWERRKLSKDGFKEKNEMYLTAEYAFASVDTVAGTFHWH